MNEISCDLCMDLLPLVQDGVASDDSVKAVERHISTCESCREAFCGEIPTSVDTIRFVKKLHRRLQLSTAILMMFGIFFGLSLTAGSNMFYNVLIMPLIGALGYYLFRKRALYIIPLLMLVTLCTTNLFGLLHGVERMDFLSVLWWTALYSVFSVLGTIAVWLLHFALKKEG